MSERTAVVERKTAETSIKVVLNADGAGHVEIDTGIPFFDHMLSLLGKHALFDLEVQAKGDLEVDFHHTVEDVGICLGQSLKKALGDKAGIRRYGWSLLPMDEALALVSLDISGRPHLQYNVELPGRQIGSFDVSLVPEFFHALVNNAGMTLHVKVLEGGNGHHIVEAIFKGLAKALETAVEINPRLSGIPSTKGTL